MLVSLALASARSLSEPLLSGQHFWFRLYCSLALRDGRKVPRSGERSRQRCRKRRLHCWGRFFAAIGTLISLGGRRAADTNVVDVVVPIFVLTDQLGTRDDKDVVARYIGAKQIRAFRADAI